MVETQSGKNPADGKYRKPLWWYIGLVVLILAIVGTFIPGIVKMVQDPDLLHQPGLADFFPEALAFKGSPFELNRMIIGRIVAASAAGLIFFLVARNVKLLPGRGQALVEMLLEFVRKNIGVELLGSRRGKRYATILSFLFVSVLAMNLTGIIPGVNIAASSVMSVPLVLAIVAYVTFVGAGIKARGGLRFFREQLFPPGIPWPVYFLLTPIEALSTFVVRPATLAIRLLANMIAGHMLLALTYFGTVSLLAAAAALKPMSALTLIASIVVTLFEIFVAALQAYVFTVLTAVYIKMSVEAH